MNDLRLACIKADDSINRNRDDIRQSICSLSGLLRGGIKEIGSREAMTGEGEEKGDETGDFICFD